MRRWTGPTPHRDGAFDLASLGAVSGQQLGLALDDVRELAFEGLCDAGVQRASRLAQKGGFSQSKNRHLPRKRDGSAGKIFKENNAMLSTHRLPFRETRPQKVEMCKLFRRPHPLPKIIGLMAFAP